MVHGSYPRNVRSKITFPVSGLGLANEGYETMYVLRVSEAGGRRKLGARRYCVGRHDGPPANPGKRIEESNEQPIRKTFGIEINSKVPECVSPIRGALTITGSKGGDVLGRTY
jgi:hypothetical protein